jgi:subfamily B ATP-binding cassette protein MsbA
MNSFKKILKYAYNYKKYAFLNIACNILSVIFELVSMLLFIPFLNLLFEQDQPVIEKPVFSVNKDYFTDYFNYTLGTFIKDNDKIEMLFYVCILVGFLFLLKNFFRYFAMFFIAVLRTGIVKDIRNAIYKKIVELPLSYFANTKKGDIISRVTTDVQEVEFSILQSLELLFREPINVILSLTLLIYINPQLTLISFVLLPATSFTVYRLGKSLKRTSAKVQHQIGALLSNIEETLGGVKIIKAFTAENAVNRNFNDSNAHYQKLNLRLVRKTDLASPLSEILGSFVMVGIAYFGGSLVLTPDSNLKSAEFITYIILFSRLLTPIKAFSKAYANIQKGVAAADRIDTIIEAENNIVNPIHPKVVTDLTTEITFKNVGFSYETSTVLDQINVTIQKGKTIALVGESGGGKSTFADLLPRFYDIDKGEILIDGINIKEIGLKNLRGLMGIVTQESILFNDTITNNIALGTKKFTQEEVIEAAKIANAHQFIMEMENGYETNIGDRGGKLSGGQRQRISIARAVLKNPPILILDEATSALDTESEKLVQDALYKLMQNRTSIVIAHRLSTIQHADEILVMQKGNIVERGTHTELLSQSGVYKKLSDLQTFAS